MAPQTYDASDGAVMIEQLSRRARRVPAALRAIILGPALLASFGVTLYFMVEETGPWLWISNAQADLVGGEYYPKLSFLLCWLGAVVVFVGPAGALVHLLATGYRDPDEPR